MKKMKLTWIALILVVSLSALLLIACGGREDAGKGLNDEIVSSGSSGGSSGGSSTSFVMADLGASAGWSILGVSSGGSNEGTIGGAALKLNTSGLVLSGSYTHSDGVSSANFTALGGTFTIDTTTGVIGGTAGTDLPSTITVASGKMNAAKDVFTFVASTNVVGEEHMFIAMKNYKTEDYEDDDLDAVWYLFGASSGGTSEGTLRGLITMDDENDSTDLYIPVTGGSYTHSDGTVVTFTGGITTDTGGRLSGTLTTDIPSTVTIPYGKMNLAMDVLSMYSTSTSGEENMFVAIKEGGTFTESDLEGTWYISGTSCSGAAEGTIVGTIILNSSGTVTGGSYTHSDGTAVTLTGGTFPINGEGELSSGNTTPFIATSGALTITVIEGKMNASKDVMSYVATTSAGGVELVFAVKGG